MPFIDVPEAPEGTPNLARIFGNRPDVYAAWRGLVTAVTSHLDVRTYELATLGAARRLRSSYCSLAHGTVLAKEVFDWDTVRGIALGDTGALDERDVAVMRFAEQVAADATSITAEDVERLRAVGLSDDEIFDVAAAAAARCFFSKLLDSLGVQPDASYAELAPDIRDALVVGRPIAGT